MSIRSFCLTGLLLIFTAGIDINPQVSAQDASFGDGEGRSQGNRRRSLVIDIKARVIEDEQTVIWNESHRKITIPGSPVGMKLVGSNVVVAVQFTPFIRRTGNVLVAQGQIWIEDPKRGMSYYTSIQTIPMDFDEPIYFFPLGTTQQQLDSSIEIILTVNPYREPSDTRDKEAAAVTDGK
jgi:hypothetical protein